MIKNLITFVSGFLLGAASGTAVALLNAPRSGKQTRQKIRHGIEDARLRAEEAIADARATTLEKLDEAKSVVREIGDEAKKSMKVSES